MKILQVVPYFEPAWAYGGPPRTVSGLSHALARRGHDVVVLTTDALAERTRMPIRLSRGDLEVHYDRNISNRLAWTQRLFLAPGNYFYLRQQAADFDLIHLHEYRSFQNVVAHNEAVCKNVPYVLSSHGSTPNILGKHALKTFYDTIWGKRILRDATRLIAVSRTEQSQYEDHGIPTEKISVIYHGIDSCSYKSLPRVGGFVKDKLERDTKVVTYIGRLHAIKGLDTLLRAFAGVNRNNRRTLLVLAGPDDGYQRRLESLTRQLGITGSVMFTGIIDMPRKLQVLADTDVVVYPSISEIFGLVPFEALACGKPVVVSNLTGCGEIIQREGAGITVAPGDIQALQRGIETSLQGGLEIETSVQRGLNFVRKELDWDRIAARTEALYEDAIRKEC